MHSERFYVLKSIVWAHRHMEVPQTTRHSPCKKLVAGGDVDVRWRQVTVVVRGEGQLFMDSVHVELSFWLPIGKPQYARRSDDWSSTLLVLWG